MNFSDTIRRLLRRWYIVLAGFVLAAAAGYGAWIHTPTEYQRSASQLLLPGSGSLPSRTANPYLYLGGLTQAADVVARVAGSDDTLSGVVERYPGTVVSVSRDPSTSGPVILITATSSSDSDAADVVEAMVTRTAAVLEQVQSEEGVAARDRMTITTLTIDRQPTLQQRKRLIATGGSAAGIIVFSLLAASLLDGLVRRRATHAATTDSVSTAPLAVDGKSVVDRSPVDDLLDGADLTLTNAGTRTRRGSSAAVEAVP